MLRVQSCVSGLLLAVSATAWAGVEPYPEAVIGPSVSTKTRAEVVAELHEAIRAGQMYDFPKMFADTRAYAESGSVAAAGASSVTQDGDTVVVWGDARVVRARISAETQEANRLGLLAFGEGDPPIATAEQEALIAAAGRRAVSQLQIARSH